MSSKVRITMVSHNSHVVGGQCGRASNTVIMGIEKKKKPKHLHVNENVHVPKAWNGDHMTKKFYSPLLEPLARRQVT